MIEFSPVCVIRHCDHFFLTPWGDEYRQIPLCIYFFAEKPRSFQ